ncbi:MAG TPA: hypothetical protein VHM25_21145, partial [Polyangiaceae bacterium]|nr:hypothetical protein [Polyangiaceae bacterium]
MKRSLAQSARALFVSLVIVGQGGCQGLGPTSGAAPREEVVDTQLPLPDDSAWTSFPNSEARRYYAGVELGDGSVLVCGGSSSTKKYVQTCNRLSFDGALRSQS